ncbi:hypothetical protein HFP89_02995 [Wenzhouxiangella sp. XN79A]|uniref:hypothetical protein n=1 Tax=Wenzhouxiangella sp. XN79A TaxID=2724193 RepID=UPI00144A79B9|nr:hypothetical protein [Wenzhouxiangella sp. XN79A]NKI34132.1 hypothetical protein [Wenzhouxiangella sp. XN79A]
MPRSGLPQFLLLALVLNATLAVAGPDVPASWRAGAELGAPIELRTLPPLDAPKLAAEDAVAEAFGQPPRFALPFDLVESPAGSGGWTTGPDTAWWRLRIEAPDAVSLNFGFRNVQLVEGAKLWIYPADAAGQGTLDRSRVLGPYGPEINEKHGEFWTPVLAAGDVIIELEAPLSTRHEVSLELARVNQGYRGFGQVAQGYRQPASAGGEGKRESDCDKSDGGARSGSCNMDVACLAPDDPWNEPRRSVARYTLEGQFLCTGSLVNNTANDRRMLFATASHCGVEPGNSSTIVAYWNYEWPTCRTPGAAAGSQVNPPDASQTSSGAVYLAGTSDPFSAQTCSDPGDCSDFALVEFDDPADPSLDLFWAGWDRRSAPASCGPQGEAGSTAGLCASIHHPSGDEKRITFVDSDLEEGSIAFAQGVHWHAFWHPDPPVVAGIPSPQPPTIPPGVTEPGSSGSPLYSANQRLVGVLSGGPAFCGATGVDLSDFYGQLAHAWNGLGSPSTRMRDHLDPLGSGAQFVDGIGSSPFRLDYAGGFVEACRTDGSVQIDIDVDGDAGFTSPVSLSASGLPAGASASFSPNPVTPSGSSTLTVGNLAGATTGAASITVQGASGGSSGSALVPFHLGSSVPSPVSPALPANAATIDDSEVELSWTGSGQAAGYRVEVATDFAFGDVVFDQVVRGATVVSVSLASRGQYFWRVTARNGCGTAAPSATRSFITAPQTGECPIGQQATVFWSDDMESGPNGWTLGAGSVQNTWAQITSDSVSGTTSWNAINVDSISDQRLVSPPIELPAAGALSLRFQNRQQMESAGSGCFDGAVLEISTDDGGSWTELSGDRIGFRPHDGPISDEWENPLAGSPAWCGDPRGWEDYAIDLSDFAGETVRLRYRLATDSSIGDRDGWLVDDVRVLGCGGVTSDAPVSGNWFNPQRSGEGCQLTREANGSTHILTCYVYNRNDPFSTDQVWMIGTGTVADGAFVSTDMVITGGADYGSAFDPDEVNRIPFGTVRMDFDDCNSGAVTMNPIVAGFEDVVLPMQKIVPVDCAGGIPDPANAVRAGNWFDPDRSGEGFQLAVEGTNGLHVITFYTYLDGEPAWLIGTGTIQGDTIVFADTVITSGTGFGANFDPDEVVRTPFGTLTLTFSDCNNATIDVDSVLPQFEDQTLDLTRIVQGQCP